LTRALIDIRIDDFAVFVDDNCPAAIALALRPGMVLGERIGVGKKELYMDSVSVNYSTDD
jgi:hypothetical protein